MNFQERKKLRSDYYFKFIFGYKLRKCISCSGTGFYDNDKSPICSSCEGTGKEKYDSKPELKRQ